MSDPTEQPAERPARRARWTSQPLVSVELRKGRLAEGLAARLAALIETGVWAAGMKLPSTRTLARDHGISRNTAIAALGILATEGLIGMRDRSVAHVLPGKARPAAPRPPAPGPGATLSAFDIGYARRWPVPEWGALERRVWMDADALLAAAPVQGLASLRREIGHILLGAKGLRVAPERLIVTESDIESVRLILEHAAGEPARLVLDRSAFDAAQAAALAGLLDRPVVRAASEDVLAQNGRTALAFMTCLPLRRANGLPVRAVERSALLAWADRQGGLLIERDEDWAAVPPGTGRSLAAGSERVFHLTCFGRMISPELPIAALVCPAECLERLARGRGLARGAINTGLQACLASYLRDGHLAAHLRRRATAMAGPAAALARAARIAFGAAVEVRPALHRDSVRLRIGSGQGERLAASLRASGFWVTCADEPGGVNRLRVTPGDPGADDGRIAMAMAAAARLFDNG